MEDLSDWFDDYMNEDPKILPVLTEVKSDVSDSRYYSALKFFHTTIPFISLSSIPPSVIIEEFLQ